MKNNRYSMYLAILLLSFFNIATSYALIFPLPAKGSDLVGENFTIRAQKGDTLAKLGQRYNVGVHEMIEANPRINPYYTISTGSPVLIPQQHILPKWRKGIVINLAELRLYYFPKDKQEVLTYPIAIGRIGWNTPTAVTSVIAKTKDPDWRPPASIRQYVMETKGEVLPDVVPAGPKNPLGIRAIRLGLEGYLIHGTNAPESVGRRVSSGCMRMNNNDVAELYEFVKVGTPVKIINETHKVGWHHGKLYLQAHKPLSDSDAARENSAERAVSLVRNIAGDDTHVDLQRVRHTGAQQLGVPQPVGFRAGSQNSRS